MNFMRYQYPNVVAFHTPNGGARNAREGAKFKKMGVLKGVPDVLICSTKLIPNTALHLFERDESYCPGMAIELKIPPNRVTHEQQVVLNKFANQGWITRVITTFDDFEREVTKYLKL